MICPIVTSPIILQIPSTEAAPEDISTGQNLKETLQAHAHECVGMAANMIGAHKRIITVLDQSGIKHNSNGSNGANTKTNAKASANTKAKSGTKANSETKAETILMYNPEIIQSSQPYQTQEGYLSLPGIRNTTRFERIQVRYFDEQFQEQTELFEGFTAQIIQHEIDHCNGILI